MHQQIAAVSPLSSPAPDIDPLTGLANQTGLRKAIRTRLPPSAPPSALLYVVLDRSERVHHGLGARQRDALLVEVAHLLRDTLRASDCPARLSDDTFAICLTALNGPDHARELAHRIHDQLQSPLQLSDGPVYAPAHIGLVPDLTPYDCVETVLRNADTARYEATHSGRPIVTYETDLTRRAETQVSLEAALRKGLDNDEFVPFFQPIVSLSDGTLHSLEILARWCHPQKGLLSPGAFLDAAETTGLLVPIGHQVIRKALKRVATIQPDQAPSETPSLAANFPRREFFRTETPDFLSTLLSTYDIAPANFTMEISERAMAPLSETDLTPLRALKDLGVNLVLDDFGTGLSSIQSLRRLPIDGFKIDKSLLAPANDPSWNPDLVNLVVQMGHTLDQTVTVEGIEQVHQLHALQNVGCAYGQGYLFGRPAPASQIASLLSDSCQSRFWPPKQCSS